VDAVQEERLGALGGPRIEVEEKKVPTFGREDFQEKFLGLDKLEQISVHDRFEGKSGPEFTENRSCP